jgi:hypothetical protein
MPHPYISQEHGYTPNRICSRCSFRQNSPFVRSRSGLSKSATVGAALEKQVRALGSNRLGPGLDPRLCGDRQARAPTESCMPRRTPRLVAKSRGPHMRVAGSPAAETSSPSHSKPASDFRSFALVSEGGKLQPILRYNRWRAVLSAHQYDFVRETTVRVIGQADCCHGIALPGRLHRQQGR